jgi:predicted DCC family thiol-disulfide oxidoreductase YuxK
MQVKHPEYTVYYDGACQLCSAEMKNLMQRDTAGHIAFIDASLPGFDAGALGVTRAAVMNALHVKRLADGAWLIGIPAFEALYRATGQHRVAGALRHPLLAALAARAYPWVARNRHRLPRAPITWLFERAGRRAAERAVARTQACQGDAVCRRPAATPTTDTD